MKKGLLLILAALATSVAYGETEDSSAEASLVEAEEKAEGKFFEGSFNQQYNYIDKNNSGTEQLEMTLAKGDIKLGDKIRLDYDVDKDIYFDKDGNKTHDGMDTAYGIAIDSGSYNGWNFENYLGMEWDAKDDGPAGNRKLRPTKEQYYWAPRANKQITEKTWFQFDPRLVLQKDSDSYFGGEEDLYGDIRLQFDTDLGNGWSNWLEIYNFVGESVATAGQDYQLDVENYLKYDKQLAGDLHFFNEFGVEAYGMANNDNTTSIDVYAAPELQYRASIGDNFTVTPYVGYKVIFKGGEDDASEAKAGIKLGTKF